MGKYIRYRFTSTSIGDYRPIKDSVFILNKLPWWCTGYGCDGKYVTIVCYLPVGYDLLDYWPEAAEIESEEVEEVVYTSRFPKPAWC